MKKILLLTLFLTCSAGMLFAQDRFLDEVFDDVEITRNIPYGTNWTVLTIPVTGHSFEQPLIFDKYEPAGDLAAERPVILYWHTGNFLPIGINQGVNGSMRDSATVEICTRLAKRGYVVLSCDYRLGWNPLAPTQPQRAFDLINAAYRGVQDFRTAAKYLRVTAMAGNPHRIDTSRITAFGQGTGAYITYAAAVFDDYLEVVMTEMPAGKFLTDLNGDGVPDPMIIQPINGDPYADAIVGQNPANGDTLAEPIYSGVDASFDLGIQLGGAMADIGWLEAGDVPMISFQVPTDGFAPYESDVLRVGTSDDLIVEVQGAKLVVEKSHALGNNSVFDGMDTSDPYSQGAIAASAVTGHPYYEGLYPFNQELNMFGNVEGAPWEWWEPSRWDTVASSTPPFTLHQTASFFNAGASRAKAAPYIDTILGYAMPRAYVALNLADWSAVDNISPEEVAFSMTPNPASDFITFESKAGEQIIAITISDLSGNVIKQAERINTNQTNVSLADFTSGLYIASVRFEKGIVNEKFVVNK